MSLPADARHRWGLDDGGRIGYLDVGGAILLIPGGIDKLRNRVLESVNAMDWDATRTGFGDPDLATE